MPKITLIVPHLNIGALHSSFGRHPKKSLQIRRFIAEKSTNCSINSTKVHKHTKDVDKILESLTNVEESLKFSGNLSNVQSAPQTEYSGNQTYVR